MKNSFYFLLFCLFLFGCNQEESIINDSMNQKVSDSQGKIIFENQKQDISSTEDCDQFFYTVVTDFPYADVFSYASAPSSGCEISNSSLPNFENLLDIYYRCFHAFPPPTPLIVNQEFDCSDYVYIHLYKVCSNKYTVQPNEGLGDFFKAAPNFLLHNDPNNFVTNTFQFQIDQNFPFRDDFKVVTDFAESKINKKILTSGLYIYPYMDIDFFRDFHGLDNNVNECNECGPENCITGVNSENEQYLVCGNEADVYVRIRGCQFPESKD